MVDWRRRGGNANTTSGERQVRAVPAASRYKSSTPSLLIRASVTQAPSSTLPFGNAPSSAATMEAVPPASRAEGGVWLKLRRRSGGPDDMRCRRTSPLSYCVKLVSPSALTRRLNAGCISGQNQDGPRSNPSCEIRPVSSVDRMRPPSRGRASSSRKAVPAWCSRRPTVRPATPPPTMTTGRSEVSKMENTYALTL